MNKEVLSEIKGQSLIITFNRSEQKNALNMDMAQQLYNLLKNAMTDRGIRAVILRGQGGNFMYGLDLQIYTNDFGTGVERANQMMLPYNSAIRELQAMEKPVLAVVEGSVAGPGISFMLASDLVLAGRSTKFNCGFTSYALSPDGGASFFLAHKAGPMKANQLLMMNETIDAAEAERLHLVSAVVDDDKLHDEAMVWAERLASAATRAVGAAKILVSKAYEQNLNQHLAMEHAYWGACSRSFDFREAIKALIAKRLPKYTGA